MKAENTNRFSYARISTLVAPQSRVLDLGCGSGELMQILRDERGCSVVGVDSSEVMVLECIKKGLSVFQSDLDEGLRDYPSKGYDYVILNQTLQMLYNIEFVLGEMRRVGRYIIVNFPNFGHYVNRLQLGFLGRMPQNEKLPYDWHSTPNIHFCTRKDFLILSAKLRLQLRKEICLNSAGRRIGFATNIRASEVCMLLEEAEGK